MGPRLVCLVELVCLVGMPGESGAKTSVQEAEPSATGKKCPFLSHLQGLKCRTTHLNFLF